MRQRISKIQLAVLATDIQADFCILSADSLGFEQASCEVSVGSLLVSSMQSAREEHRLNCRFDVDLSVSSESYPGYSTGAQTKSKTWLAHFIGSVHSASLYLIHLLSVATVIQLIETGFCRTNVIQHRH